MWTRRGALIGGLALAGCEVKVDLPPSASVSPADDARIAAIEARIGGRVGVFALNTANGRFLQHRGAEPFAMCSTFKWLLAAQILWIGERMAGYLALPVLYTEDDLLDYAPAARARFGHGPAPQTGQMSAEELAEAAVVLSDNTAANLLLTGVGGPAGFTRFLREHGDVVTRLDRNEPSLNENLPGDARDTTTPEAMAQTMRRFLVADDGALNAASRDKLIGWLVASPTGRERLRAGLPANWRAGDKTGTSTAQHNATNDVMIAWPPNGGAPIIIACYLSVSAAPIAERNAAHAEVARIVAEDWG